MPRNRIILLEVLVLAGLFCGLRTAMGQEFVGAIPREGRCAYGRKDIYYVPSLQLCAMCMNNSLFNPATAKCECTDGFAEQVNVLTGARYCTDCAKRGHGVSSYWLPDGTRECVRCGTAADITSNFVAPMFTAGVGCTCPTGYALGDSYGDIPLNVQLCTPCQNGTVDPEDSFKCITCNFPFVLGKDGTKCVCAPNYQTLSDGSCVASSRVQELLSAVGTASRDIVVRNIDNSGKNEGPTTSWIVAEYFNTAATLCSLHNYTACSFLANMCVLATYHSEAAPCALYTALHELEDCRGMECEVPKYLPWLHYIRSSPLILQDENINIKVELEDRMKFVLSTFSWNGSWLGNTLVTNQLHMCDLSGAHALEFYIVGSNRYVECDLNLKWFVGAPETQFYELFLMDDEGNLKDVPVLLDYSTKDLDPVHIHDSSIYRSGTTAGLTMSENGYRRRFYLYDNVGTKPSVSSFPDYVTFARRIVFMIALQPTQSSQIYSPLLIIQYASKKVQPMLETINFKMNELLPLRTNTTSGVATMKGSMKVKFTMDTDRMNKGLMITLIVVCCLSVMTAWIRVYGWMRRQQEMMMGMSTFIRFIIYYLNHLSNWFFLITMLTCVYMYLFYKFQAEADSALPETNKYLWAMLYTATAGRGLVVLYRVWEQCNADVFVIDWERSKGLLRKDDTKEIPVSMWRSTFVTNEFNELQTLRGWRPLLCLITIMIFLEGLKCVNWAASVPWNDRNVSDTAKHHPFLRIAVTSMFWVLVPTVFNFIEYYVYYKFLCVHPLQAFLDLCSVSNISVIILLEPQWGFYIHGESVHDHADISMEEFQENLKRESLGHLPLRGLGGLGECQTFEVFIGTHLRTTLRMSYEALYIEYQKTLQGAAGPVDARYHRRCFDFLIGGPGQNRTYTPETLEIKSRINQAFIDSVRNGEKTLSFKFPAHQLLDFPPNIMAMNGFFMGGQSQDLYFLDKFDGFGKTLLYGIDFDLFMFYFLLFLSIDSSLMNTYLTCAIIYVIDLLLVWYREHEGQANLGAKTLFSDKFFL